MAPIDLAKEMRLIERRVEAWLGAREGKVDFVAVARELAEERLRLRAGRAAAVARGERVPSRRSSSGISSRRSMLELVCPSSDLVTAREHLSVSSPLEDPCHVSGCEYTMASKTFTRTGIAQAGTERASTRRDTRSLGPPLGYFLEHTHPEASQAHMTRTHRLGGDNAPASALVARPPIL